MDGTALLQGAYVLNTEGTKWSAPDPWQFAGVGDFNRDGLQDLAWYYKSTTTPQQGGIWYLNGTTAVGSDSLPAAGTIEWENVGVDHIDQDGKCDLIWWNRSNYTTAVWYMNGNVIDRTASETNATASANLRFSGSGDSKLDTDADSLPDVWERNHFGNLNQGPYGDWDADGLTNLQEYQTLSSPTDFLGLQTFTPLE